MVEDSPPAASREVKADQLSARLLQSVVDVARAIFGAQASSIFLLDEDTDELVFQAVSGRGEDHLIGRAFPAGRGIAGWVVASGEPLVVDDLSGNAAFDRDFATSTSYVPNSLMAAPLIDAGRVLGVLEVLDPAPAFRSSLNELDVLALFANQAAISLRVVSDRAHAGAASRDGTVSGLPLGPDGRAAALQLMDSLRQLLEETGRG